MFRWYNKIMILDDDTPSQKTQTSGSECWVVLVIAINEENTTILQNIEAMGSFRWKSWCKRQAVASHIYNLHYTFKIPKKSCGNRSCKQQSHFQTKPLDKNRGNFLNFQWSRDFGVGKPNVTSAISWDILWSTASSASQWRCVHQEQSTTWVLSWLPYSASWIRDFPWTYRNFFWFWVYIYMALANNMVKQNFNMGIRCHLFCKS